MPQRKKNTSKKASAVTASKKQPVKLVVKKKIVSKGKAKPKTTLIKTQGPTCFWVHEGEVLCDLRELLIALRNNTITDAQWKHHVTSERNDFANWIQDVFRNVALAQKFKAAKTKSAAYTVLNTSLKT